jgi:WD40 repeat protein
VSLKEAHPGWRWLSLSPDGRWLASGAWQNPTVKIYDASAGEVVKHLKLEGMSSVAFSPDGRWLVIGGKDFKFLEVGTWEVKRRLERPPAEVFPPAITFSRDGKILAVSHSWRTVRLINPHTGEELATLEAPKPWMISSLSFNADASLLAVASEKGSDYHLWNLRLVRQQLAAMNLDWDMPAYPRQDAALTNRPFRIIFHTNGPAGPATVGEQ